MDEAGEGIRMTRIPECPLLPDEGTLLGPLPCGVVGDDASRILGVTKYEPPVPLAWRGECVHLPGWTVPYDIRSARRHPGVIGIGEPVEITEKLHGTMCAVGYFKDVCIADTLLIGGDTIVYSKGLGETGHVLKASNQGNLYIRAAIDHGLRERLRAAFNGRPATAFGEIYGKGVQDLAYGKGAPSFALFDIYLGVPGRGRWLNRKEFGSVSGEIAATAPALYAGPLRAGIVQQLASGSTVAGNMAHLREGIVIRPAEERNHPRIGRTILKYVSHEYLTRACGTEFH
jgi:RNA ligase (TIGR02306 family)